MHTLRWHDAPLVLSQCGSMGSLNTTAQMVACIGQQSVSGKRSVPHDDKRAPAPHPDALGARTGSTGGRFGAFPHHADRCSRWGVCSLSLPPGELHEA